MLFLIMSPCSHDLVVTSLYITMVVHRFHVLHSYYSAYKWLKLCM